MEQIQIFFNSSDTVEVFVKNFKKSTEHVQAKFIGHLFKEAFFNFSHVVKNCSPELEVVMWTDSLSWLNAQVSKGASGGYFYMVDVEKVVLEAGLSTSLVFKGTKL